MINELKSPRCPNCRTASTHRVPRVGVAERLLSLFSIFPFACRSCRRRFRAAQRGVRYVRNTLDPRGTGRLAAALPAQIHTGNVVAHGSVVDVSLHGCAIQTPLDPPPGSRVQVEIDLPTRTLGVPVVVTLIGAVRHSSSGRIGVRIVDMSDAHREQYRKFLVSEWLRRAELRRHQAGRHRIPGRPSVAR
jgi:hypothetical protein